MGPKTKDRNNLSVIACIPLMMLTAFGNKVFPVKGNYMNGPSVSIQINRKDSVWTKLIDFCSREGLSIKIIDKSSGLLTFEKLEVNWTYENDSVPEPKNKSAWVVLSKKRQGVVIAKPSLVTGEWSVPVQDNRDGGVKVFINLIYVKYTTVYHDRYYKYTKKNVPQAFSTGTLEKLLFENIG